jgi:lipid-binding SYLF domain-containing protein
MHPTGLTKRSMVKIPPEVLRNCAGLAIFNVLRAGGWHGSLSGGSGVVIARRADGTWSPPSAFLVSSLGAGIVAGLEVYDTVCVLNTQAQVDSFASSRFALGGSGSIAVGPVGSGTAVQAAVRKTGRPMWSYIKSRGLFFGVQIDGTVIVGRGDANAAFYGEPGITAAKILREDVAWPVGAKPLFDVLMAMDSQTQAAPAGAEEHATQQAAVSENPSAPLLVKRYSDIKQATPAPLSDNDNRDQRSDIYGDSVADEKERLAKSGF